MIAWVLFTNPVSLGFYSPLWLLLPLCLSVSIVYKTIRTPSVTGLAWQILYIFLYILGGLAALCGALWLILVYWK